MALTKFHFELIGYASRSYGAEVVRSLRRGTHSLSGNNSKYLRQNIRTMSSNNSSGGSGKALTMDNLNPHVIALEYAVRGPLVIRAGEIEKEIEKVCAKKTFTDA